MRIPFIFAIAFAVAASGPAISQTARPTSKPTSGFSNKEIVERYMDGFRRSDHAAILSCLTDDVEWIIPGAFHKRGKAEFDKEIENEAFVGSPSITVTRLTEENDVVIAEGTVRTEKRAGGFVNLAFCDVFEMRDRRIAKLTSYLMETK